MRMNWVIFSGIWPHLESRKQQCFPTSKGLARELQLEYGLDLTGSVEVLEAKIDSHPQHTNVGSGKVFRGTAITCPPIALPQKGQECS